LSASAGARRPIEHEHHLLGSQLLAHRGAERWGAECAQIVIKILAEGREGKRKNTCIVRTFSQPLEGPPAGGIAVTRDVESLQTLWQDERTGCEADNAATIGRVAMMVLRDNTVSRPSPTSMTLPVLPKRIPLPSRLPARARDLRLVPARRVEPGAVHAGDSSIGIGDGRQ
jgi:hypothetical protein